MNRRRAALALILLSPLASHAAEFNRVINEQSTIRFSYTQMGVVMQGGFRQSATALSFDPANPTRAAASVDVALGSVDAGSEEADKEVVSAPWFNTKAFPTAHFASTAVRSLGGNRYELTGQLTIKGHTRTVIVPATFAIKGPQGMFDGSFRLKRGDFGIGEGPWAAFDIVANDIQVQFHLVAAQAP
jgi:polyisoprenoid-binding protein YceI